MGTGGVISSTLLSTLQSLVAGDLARLNPGFVGDDLVELETYLVLDRFENRTGSNNVKSEKIKDYQITYKDAASSSCWMDKALLKISTYRSSSLTFDIVERSDSRMKSMSSDMIRPEEWGTVDTANIDEDWGQDYE